MLIYIIFGFVIYLIQAKFVYFPDKSDFYSCGSFNGAQKLNANGTRFYFKRNSERLLIIYHGNAGSACDRNFLKKVFEDAGYSYIFVEYAGYANDKKSPSKKLLMQDVRNINSFVKDGKFKKVVLFGESLGTALASYHSTLADANGIILVAPFDSMLNVAKRQYPMYPVGLLLKEDYDNIKNLKDYKGKITIIHGSKESIIPISMARNLFENLDTSKKSFIAIEGAGHNDIYDFKHAINAINESL